MGLVQRQDSYKRFLELKKKRKHEKNRDKKQPVTKSEREELQAEIKRLRKIIKNLVKVNDNLKIRLQKYGNKRKNNSKVLPK